MPLVESVERSESGCEADCATGWLSGTLAVAISTGPRRLNSQDAKPRPETEPRKLLWLVFCKLKQGWSGSPFTVAQTASPLTLIVPAGSWAQRTGRNRCGRSPWCPRSN